MGYVHNIPWKNVIADDDGNPPYALGVVLPKWGTVTFENATDEPALICTLPEGAVILGWLVNVDEAFDGDADVEIDLGDADAADRFAGALDVSAEGQISIGFEVAELFVPLTENTDVLAVFNGTGTPTAGHATVCVFWTLGISKG